MPSAYIIHNGVYSINEEGNALFVWSGSGVSGAFYGTQIAVELSTTVPNAGGNKNYLAYSIDGGEYQKFAISGTNKTTYTLVTGLKLGYHTVDVVKVTESSYLGGIITFYGFDYLNGAPAAPQNKDKSIWFIGDSITAGFGAEGSYTNNSFVLAEENVTSTYGFKTAQAFGANYRATAISGGGLVRDGGGDQGLLLPKHINNTHYADTDTKMNGYEEPDVIVVALGANDFASGVADVTEEYIMGYHTFIDILREKCPNAKIVCAINSYYTSAVNAVNQVVAEEFADGYNDVTICVMTMDNTNNSYIGAANHPSASGHTVLSNSLITHISELMNW